MRLKTIILAALAVLILAPGAMAQDMRDPITGQNISGKGSNPNSKPPRGSGLFGLFEGSTSIDPKYAPGSIVIITKQRKLYFVTAPGTAIEYNIGVGRAGFTWSGVKSITRKAEWPDWTPPPEMLKRRPDLPKHMVGGPENPLGARALYLGSSLYRIHGTNEPYTIGQNVSSGCIRMMNGDVEDLYDRVRVGTKVVVL